MAPKSHNRSMIKEKNSKQMKNEQSDLPDEIALRDEIFQLKRQMMMLKKANEKNIVKVRKYEDEAKKKDRQIEQLMDPVKGNRDVRKLLSTKGAALLLNLKEQNNTLIQMILDKDVQIRRLTGEIKTSKLYGNYKKADSYRTEIDRLRNLLIKSQNVMKEAQGMPQRRSICIGGSPGADVTASSDQSSPRDLEELQFTIRSLETHMKYSNELLAKKNEQIIYLTDQLNSVVSANQCDMCGIDLPRKCRSNRSANQTEMKLSKFRNLPSSQRDGGKANGSSDFSQLANGAKVPSILSEDDTPRNSKLFDRNVSNQPREKERKTGRLANSAPSLSASVRNCHISKDFRRFDSDPNWKKKSEVVEYDENSEDSVEQRASGVRKLRKCEEAANDFPILKRADKNNGAGTPPDITHNTSMNAERTETDEHVGNEKEIHEMPTADEYNFNEVENVYMRKITLESNGFNNDGFQDDSDMETAEFELMEKEIENDEDENETPARKVKSKILREVKFGSHALHEFYENGVSRQLISPKQEDDSGKGCDSKQKYLRIQESSSVDVVTHESKQITSEAAAVNCCSDANDNSSTGDGSSQRDILKPIDAQTLPKLKFPTSECPSSAKNKTVFLTMISDTDSGTDTVDDEDNVVRVAQHLGTVQSNELKNNQKNPEEGTKETANEETNIDQKACAKGDERGTDSRETHARSIASSPDPGSVSSSTVHEIITVQVQAEINPNPMTNNEINRECDRWNETSEMADAPKSRENDEWQFGGDDVEEDDDDDDDVIVR